VVEWLAQPSPEFDAKGGHKFLTPDESVGIVYRDLSRPPRHR
jgi:hypothetical protein